MNMPYQLKYLSNILARLKASKTIITMDALCAYKPQEAKNLMVVRCDIERNLPHALLWAQKAHKLKIPCTMYFHTHLDCYDPKVFIQIRNLGHEIGYHHECLDRCGGNFSAARELFLCEVEQFRRDGFSVTTVCSHGENGLSRKSYKANWELFERYPGLLKLAGIKAEVYTTINKHWNPIYASDTFTSYKNFWATIDRGAGKSNLLQILVHPHRWHYLFFNTAWEAGKDLLQMCQNRLLGKKRYRTILN